MTDFQTTAGKAGISHTVIETPEEIAYELRAAEGAVWTGSRLLIGMVSFVYASLAFAYFYLRSTNNQDLWRPGGVTASLSFGTTILVVALASSLLNVYGTWRWRTGSVLDSNVAGWLTVLGGSIAVGIQVWQLFELHFWPGSSGYASCFIAWAILNAALLLSGVYWSETMLARAARVRRSIGGVAAASEASAPTPVVIAPEEAAAALAPDSHAAAYPVSDRILDTEVVSCSHYWVFIGIVNLVFWLMFYVI
jgi:heme/copper-type cytochrome/quinol oxidase subunit 3